MSFLSDTGLTTPRMRFLLQSLMLTSGDSLGQVRLPVRSIRSSRALLLVTLLCWNSLTGENSGIEIRSSLDVGLECNQKHFLMVPLINLKGVIQHLDDLPDLHGLHLVT